MTKLVWKTITITLASILLACFLIFGAFALFSPITLAKFFDQTGSKKIALFFYEKQYEKTEDIEDLSRVVLKIDDNDNSLKSEKFLAKLINHADFNKFCSKQNVSSSAISAEEYYYGRYAVVLISNGKVNDSLTTASEFVEKYGYTENNSYTVIILRCRQELDSEHIQTLKTRLNEMLNDLNLSADERQRINDDLLELN